MVYFKCTKSTNGFIKFLICKNLLAGEESIGCGIYCWIVLIEIIGSDLDD